MSFIGAPNRPIALNKGSSQNKNLVRYFPLVDTVSQELVKGELGTLVDTGSGTVGFKVKPSIENEGSFIALDVDNANASTAPVGLEYTGSSKYTLTPGQAFTVSGWVQLRNFTGEVFPVIINIPVSSGEDIQLFLTNNATYFGMGSGRNTGTERSRAFTGKAESDLLGLHFFALTNDGSNWATESTWRYALSFGNSLEFENGVTVDPFGANAANRFIIGNRSVLNAGFDGFIWNIGIRDKKLSDTEITNLFNIQTQWDLTLQPEIIPSMVSPEIVVGPIDTVGTTSGASVVDGEVSSANISGATSGNSSIAGLIDDANIDGSSTGNSVVNGSIDASDIVGNTSGNSDVLGEIDSANIEGTTTGISIVIGVTDAEIFIKFFNSNIEFIQDGSAEINFKNSFGSANIEFVQSGTSEVIFSC